MARISKAYRRASGAATGGCGRRSGGTRLGLGLADPVKALLGDRVSVGYLLPVFEVALEPS